MSAKQLLLGHENIGAKAFLETENRLQRATRGVTLIFLRYFAIFKKNPHFEAGGAQDSKRYLPYKWVLFLASPS